MQGRGCNISGICRRTGTCSAHMEWKWNAFYFSLYVTGFSYLCWECLNGREIKRDFFLPLLNLSLSPHFPVLTSLTDIYYSLRIHYDTQPRATFTRQRRRILFSSSLETRGSLEFRTPQNYKLPFNTFTSLLSFTLSHLGDYPDNLFLSYAQLSFVSLFGMTKEIWDLRNAGMRAFLSHGSMCVVLCYVFQKLVTETEAQI